MAVQLTIGRILSAALAISLVVTLAHGSGRGDPVMQLDFVPPFHIE